jgi:predicted phosphodiesterase
MPDIFHLSVNDVHIYIIHNVHELEIDPAAEGFSAVISGHSHKPGLVSHDNLLFLNPGSAGPRRFKLPVTVARMDIHRSQLHSKIVELKFYTKLC